MHEINVTGYNAATEEKSLNLGTAASYGVEKLHITFDAAWDDLSKSATFNCGKPGRGLRPVTRMIDENGIVDVPQEATAVATKDGTITLLGVAPGSGQRISVDIPYTVTGHAAVPGQTAEDKPSAFEQILEAAQGAERAAQKAQEAAGTAKDEAQAGAEAASKQATASAQAAEKSAAQAEASASEAQGHSAQAGQYAQQTADAVALGQQAAGDARTDRLAAESAQQEATKHEQAAKDAATDAGTAKTAAEGSATAAAESAELAKQQADAAGKSAILAQSAADTATEAKADAMDAQTAAEDAQDKALTAQTCAETAQGKAEDAAKTATGAADRAEEAAAQVQPIDDAAITTTSPWSSKQIVDTLCPPLEESGNPVVCYPVAGYSLGVKASWEPMQEGSGTPSAENIRPIKGRDSVTVERCGENVIEFLSINDFNSNVKIAIDAGKNITLNGTVVIKSNITIGTCRLHWAAGKTYTMYVKKVGGSASLESGDGITFAYSLFAMDYEHYFRGDTASTNLDAYIASNAALAETEFIFMLQRWRVGTVFNNFKFQIEVVPGTTAPTTYTPYNGQTNTLILPETVYGGEVDAVTDAGKETWALLTLDGTENWNTWGVNANNSAVTGFYTYDINDYDAKNVKGICSNLPHPDGDTWGGRNSGIGFATVGSSRYFMYCIPTAILADVSDNSAAIASLKSYLAAQYAAGTPVQVCYKLAEPVPFTATGGDEITALSGVNTILTDADTVAVTGREDIVHAISELRTAKATDVEG